MQSAVLICLAIMASCCAIAAAASAHRALTKSHYIARADAVCGRAVMQPDALGVVPSVHAWAGAAGTRLLAIDRAALGSLERLAPPHGDAATLRGLLRGVSSAVAETGRAIGAARAGNMRVFRSHAAAVAVLSRRNQAGARAYGFDICARWGR
jgi:hypothetical protein